MVAEDTDQNKNEPVYNWENQTILIVEDDLSSYRLLEALFRRTKVNIIHAKAGEEAVEKCVNNPGIDLVLMDIQLPKMDGYEATQKIKAYRRNLPVIAQTAYAMEEEKVACLKAGCDDYISKPINKNQLLRMMNKFL